MSRHMEDAVGSRIGQGAAELPDVDTAGMAVFGRLRRITLALRPEIEAIFSRHGLDVGEFDVVSTLLRSGPPYRLTPTELYRSLMISSGGLTSRLDKLEARGWIERRAGAIDGRSREVQLTDDGRKRTEQAFREDMAFERDILEVLPKARRNQLSELLAELSRYVDNRSRYESGQR